MKSIIRSLVVLVASATFSLAAEGWETNWEKARERAASEKKPILLNLTGTDWCAWCIKLEKEVFTSEEFKEFAAKHLILMEADFPRKKEQPAEIKEQNAKLKKEYLQGGYPTVFLVDAEGKKLSEDLGELEGGTAAWIKKLTELIEASKKDA